jgi:predicted extracellular nuclease
MNSTKRLTVVSFCCLAFVAAPVATAVDCDGAVPIYEIQGRSHVSPYVGDTVETCGVVTAVGFQNYYLQDPDGDGDSDTSDGINVFDSRSGAIPAVGSLVRLRDRVDERIPGGPDTGNLSITQFAFPEIIESESGVQLPDPVVIGRSGRRPPARTVISESEIASPINLQNAADAATTPFNPHKDGIDFYESLEGMLVTVEDLLAVSAVRQFGRFSAEFFTLANNGKFAKPRSALTRSRGINLQPDPDNRGDQNPERVQIQLGFNDTTYPPVQVGDRLGDVTGVVGYSFGNFEVNALTPIEIRRSRNSAEQVRARSPRYLTVASYNVLNLSAVDGDNVQRQKIAEQIVNNL